MRYNYNNSPGANAYGELQISQDYAVSSPPDHIDFGITNFCNLTCSFCDVGVKGAGLNFFERLVNNNGLDGHHDRRQIMPREELLRVVEQLPGFMPNGYFSIVHAEPMIHPHISQIVEDFTSRNLNLSVTTNGTILEKHAERLVRAQLNNINISFDGLRDVHDGVRGLGKFDQTLRGMRAIMDWKKKLGSSKPTIRIQNVVVKETIGDMSDFVRFWSKFDDIESITFHYLFHTTEGAAERTRELTGRNATKVSVTNEEHLKIDMDTYVKQHQKVMKMVQEGLPFRVRFKPDLPSYDHVYRYYYEPMLPVVDDRCEIPLKNLYINVDGLVTMIPRCSFENIELGNIFNSTLEEIWNDAPIREWRKALAEESVAPVCNRCCGMFVGKLLGGLNFSEISTPIKQYS